MSFLLSRGRGNERRSHLLAVLWEGADTNDWEGCVSGDWLWQAGGEKPGSVTGAFLFFKRRGDPRDPASWNRGHDRVSGPDWRTNLPDSVYLMILRVKQAKVVSVYSFSQFPLLRRHSWPKPWGSQCDRVCNPMMRLLSWRFLLCCIELCTVGAWEEISLSFFCSRTSLFTLLMHNHGRKGVCR